MHSKLSTRIKVVGGGLKVFTGKGFRVKKCFKNNGILFVYFRIELYLSIVKKKAASLVLFIIHDSNQVLRPCEIASSIMSIEGTYVLDFTPTTSTVYLRLAYHATGQDGTTAASAGAGRAGRAGSSPTGRGFSKIVLTGHIGTEEKITRWRLVKLVKNPNDYYRFGFNGQEKVNEIYGRGTHLDFGARYYDSRVARWFGVDAKIFKYPSISPYSFASNCPIIYKDFDGKDFGVEVVGNKMIIKATYYTDVNAESYQNVVDAIKYIKGQSNKYVFVDNSKQIFDIVFEFKIAPTLVSDGKDMAASARKDDEANYIHMNTNSFPLFSTFNLKDGFSSVFGITHSGGDYIDVGDATHASDKIKELYSVKNSNEFNVSTIIHEIWHSLGVDHNAMTGGGLNNERITEDIVKGILRYASQKNQDGVEINIRKSKGTSLYDKKSYNEAKYEHSKTKVKSKRKSYNGGVRCAFG